MRKPPSLLILLLLLNSLAGTAAIPGIYDASSNPEFTSEGDDILTVDYLAVWDNGVFEDGSDYPYGHIWLILYEPRRYEGQNQIGEEDWDRRDEINRVEIPGPSSGRRWASGDEVVYRDMGVHDWVKHQMDRVVFRILVEEPTEAWAIDTLMWGVIHEDDTHRALILKNENLTVLFRTLDLPEVFYSPSAEIDDTWFEHDVRMGNEYGLEIHIDFGISNLRSYPSRICAFVHHDIGDEPVRSRVDDPAYTTREGNLTTQGNFIPIYARTLYRDFGLFIPYEAFPASDRYEDYYVDIEILDDNWELVGGGRSHVFSVFNPG